MRLRGLLILALVLLAANLGWWLLRGADAAPLWQRSPTPQVSADEPVPTAPDRAGANAIASASAPAAATGTGVSAPETPRSQVAMGAAAPAQTSEASAVAPIARPADGLPTGLLIPVQGVRATDLRDTFGDARSGERMHEALDIMAPAGTPVLAVADGHVEKLFDSERGGLTIYQFEPQERWCYYYAHLQSYAPGLAEGRQLKRGDVIGYVGSTGNADPAAPHLHFAVFALTPERQWWTGTAVNPYPMFAGLDTR